MEKYLADLKWLVFQTQYCVGGGNLFESKLCRDLLPWAIGVTVLLAAFFFVVVWPWIARPMRAWLWRRAQARVANRKTMDRYRWTGDDPRK
jgi:hypothetical protein